MRDGVEICIHDFIASANFRRASSSSSATMLKRTAPESGLEARILPSSVRVRTGSIGTDIVSACARGFTSTVIGSARPCWFPTVRQGPVQSRVSGRNWLHANQNAW